MKGRAKNSLVRRREEDGGFGGDGAEENSSLYTASR